MGLKVLLLTFLLVVILFSASVSALTFSGYTDKFLYAINETIVYTGILDTNISTNITVYLIDSSGTSYNSTRVVANSLNFTTNLTSNVTSSGSYFVKSNFTYNNTYYESSTVVKISLASKFTITTSKSVFGLGETINFKVKATDANDAAVLGETVQVKLTYLTNDTNIANTSGTTDATGLFSGNFTAPSTSGSYRLVVNDGIIVKILEVSTFDLVAFSGDANGNTKLKFGINDTAYIYADLFDPNKTRYTKTESITVNFTYPNGTAVSTTLTYSGSRVNASYALDQRGDYSAKVTVLSTSKSVTLTFKVEDYELKATLSSSRGETTSFFPNDTVTVSVKVFNMSSGEQMTSNLSSGTWNLTILDSSLNFVSNVSNTTTKQPDNSYKFSFNVSLTPGIYYLQIKLNQTSTTIGFDVKGYIAEAASVDQDYNSKNVFVGNKQTIRVLTSLSNSSGYINVTNVSVVDVTNWEGTSIKANLTFNTSVVDYKGRRAGLVEFSAPTTAGWYSIKTKVQNLYEAETWFLVRLYSACAQLSNYKWFVSSNEDVALNVKVTEAKDISFIEGVSGNTTGAGSTNTTSGYGMSDCYASYTTVSGSSTTGNATSNIQISVSKVINTQTMEDVTSKISTLPTATTDDNGNTSLTISKPSGGWDGGSYIIELSMKDRNNNTDKGFGWFQVRNLWINIWPKQYSGYWKWFFSPNENLTFDVYSYNATQSWNYWSSAQGTGDNCYVLSIGYQGTGSEWFWPPKEISSSTYSWNCTNTTSPANGRFTLSINHTSSFKTGYYVVRVKVNTTTNVSDVGDGWFNIKAYNVYVRTSSSNYYDSWYKSPTDNLTFTIDVTNASSTYYNCYWALCPSSELVTEQLNISVKSIQKYDTWPQKEYSKTKYNASFINSAATTQNYTLTAFNDSIAFRSSLNITLANISSTYNVTTTSTTTQNYTLTAFNDSSTSKNITLINTTTTTTTNTTVYLSTNTSAWINIPKNATIVNASMNVTANVTINITAIKLDNNRMSLNGTMNASQTYNLSFASQLSSSLSSCTAVSNNCTLGINITINTTNSSSTISLITLSALSINYYLNETTSTNHTNTSYSITNTSAWINIPKNATIVNASMNVTANTTLTNVSIWFDNGVTGMFNGTINTNQTNITFTSALTSRLSSCTAVSNNCTLGINITSNETGLVNISSLSINYRLNQTTTNVSYWYFTTTSGTANLTLNPLAGTNNNSWESGYYSVVIEVNGSQGTESSSTWFEVRKFFVDVTTVNAAASPVNSYTSNQNITLSISAVSKPRWMIYYGVTPIYYNTTIVDMKLNYYSYSDSRTITVPVTWTPSTNISHPTIVTVIPSTTLSGGWYWMDITLRDNEGSNQTGYASFQIKDFSFSTQTANWKWEFTPTENIEINAYVCDADKWWCSDSTSYTGSNVVIVNVSKLLRTTTWPYTAVTAYTATSNQTSGSNNGRTKVTITPSSRLSSGYYIAELTARYASGNGSTQTSSVWFSVKAFTFNAYATQWEYAMRNNVTLQITASQAVTISDVSLSCGYWPNQKQYTFGSNINVNTTSIASGTNYIKLFPVSDTWASGYCWGYITATDGSSTQSAYISFSIKAFSLSISTSKYYYQKNESVSLQITTDSDQQINISTINLTNYVTSPYTVLSYPNSNSSLNLTLSGKNLTTQGTINITPQAGNWSVYGWYSGELEAVDSQNSNIKTKTWFWFSIPQPIYGYGWPVDANGNWISVNASTRNITFRTYVYKLTSVTSYYANYAVANNVKVNITKIEKENCYTWPCTRTVVTGYNAFNSTTDSNGVAYVNITKSDGWSSGNYRVSLLLNDTTNNLVDTASSLWFWVSY